MKFRWILTITILFFSFLDASVLLAQGNRASSLDGNGDFVITSASTTQEYTFSAWVKLNQYNPDANTGAVVLSDYSKRQGAIFYISNTGKLSIRPAPGSDLKGNTIMCVFY